MMAPQQEHKTYVNARVRIKDAVTHMYPAARVYSEAVVRAKTHDDLGYPMIFVEWDKDHWAYSGEEDGWTLEAHFDLVEEPMQDKDKFNELLNGLSSLVQEFKKGVEGKPSTRVDEDDDLTYDEVLNAGFDDARDGEAFILIVAHPEDLDGAQVIIPRVYVHSKREDAAMMLDATMADAAASAHARLVLNVIERGKHREPGT